MRPQVAVVAPAPPAVIPDYGGRDGASGAVALAGGSTALNPLAQAWRAFEALVIVLLGVFGVLTLLKRYGLVSADPQATAKPALTLPPSLQSLLKALPLPKLPANPLPAPAADTGSSSALTVLSSQTLPGGAALHLISVAGRTLLLVGTAQSVAVVAEWDNDEFARRTQETLGEKAAFESYLEHAGIMPERTTVGHVAETTIAATNDRLQALLERSRGGLAFVSENETQ